MRRALVARVLEGGYARLRFPRPLEQEFRSQHLLGSQRWVRLSILVALGTTLGFATIDHWVIRSSNAIPDLVRFGLQVPAILICLLATFKPFYVRLYERAIQISAPLFGMGTVLTACYAEPQHTALVGARLLLVAFFLYFMLGMRLVQALRSNLIVLAALDGLTRLLNRQTFEARVPRLAGSQSDLLARYGGEELIAVLVDRTGAEAETIAQRLVTDVAALAMPHAGSSVGSTVSISVGAATGHPSVAASYSALAKLADNALYAAKHQGRNRSVCVRMHVPDIAPSTSAARMERAPANVVSAVQ
ncbi:MAG: diguanylate cyclase domain-containing protein [Steroidobacteraceae bacterium]